MNVATRHFLQVYMIINGYATPPPGNFFSSLYEGLLLFFLLMGGLFLHAGPFCYFFSLCGGLFGLAKVTNSIAKLMSDNSAIEIIYQRVLFSKMTCLT